MQYLQCIFNDEDHDVILQLTEDAYDITLEEYLDPRHKPAL